MTMLTFRNRLSHNMAYHLPIRDLWSVSLVTHDQASQLGEFIRSLRLRSGIGLRELAGLSDISPANLSKIETGDIKEPSPTQSPAHRPPPRL